MLWVLLFISLFNSVRSDGQESRIVTIKQGSVKGYKSPDGDFYVFYGVPYATAPTGSQRFQAPLPPPVWSDTFEAVDKNVACPQYKYSNSVFNKNLQQKEDCLIANIYVPQTNEKKLPVLVYVHGGAYFIGSGNFLKPRHLVMTKKAIIVNFNYRLGVLGFLCLGTKDVPGNAGMKDQVALLRWVRDNIVSFGGNPDDVTVAGYSAGSSAVDLLMLSKMANNLFTKVIPESGANTAAFSVQRDPVYNAKEYAKRLNFSNVDDFYALEEFYKTTPYNIITAVNLLLERDSTFLFSPCVERKTGVETFLDDSPVNILKSGNYQKRPMLYGFAKMEGILRVDLFEIWKDEMNTKFSIFLPPDLKFETEKGKEAVAAKIKKFYFGDSPVSRDNIMGYIDYYTDIIFAYPTLWSIKLQVEAGNDEIYLYEYNYVHDQSTLIPHINIRGPNHCDQTTALHDGINFMNPDESMISEDYKYMKNMLREMWMNFVTTGKPIPEGSSFPAWPPTGAKGSPYMVLDRVPELKKAPLLEKRRNFWDEIYTKHFYQPAPPKESLVPEHIEL